MTHSRNCVILVLVANWTLEEVMTEGGLVIFNCSNIVCGSQMILPDELNLFWRVAFQSSAKEKKPNIRVEEKRNQMRRKREMGREFKK